MMDYGLLEVFYVELVFLKKNVFDQKDLNALDFLGSKLARQELLLVTFHLKQATFESLSKNSYSLRLVSKKAVDYFGPVYVGEDWGRDQELHWVQNVHYRRSVTFPHVHDLIDTQSSEVANDFSRPGKNLLPFPDILNGLNSPLWSLHVFETSLPLQTTILSVSGPHNLG